MWHHRILCWCWGTWNADDFVGNSGTSGEFFTMISTGLVKLLPVSNYEAHSHWQKPTTSILRIPRESYDSGSSCKIKRTWAFFIFFALKMWLTWYQVVDHVWYFQFNMAKGMCSIDDNLSTKVSPFFDTPFPSSYWLMDTKSTSSIKHAHQSLSQNLPSIDLPPHRLFKDNIDKVRCHKLFSYYTRSFGTPVICMSHIFTNSIFVFQLDGKRILRANPVPPAAFPPMNRFKYEFVGLRELVLRDCNVIIRFINSNSILTNVQNQTGI